MPLVSALFDVYAEASYRVLVLERGRFRPIINVLVTHETAANGLPSYAIMRHDERVTSASVNWQINQFAEIALTTDPAAQRAGWTESVLAALSGHIVDNGRTPIVAIDDHETGALDAAKSIGFVDIGIRDYLLEATLLP
jgi:predicted GNAT family acetyltransferase